MVTLDEAGRNRARAVVRPARGSLRALVEHDFVLDFREITSERWKVLPDVAPHLLVHFSTAAIVPTLMVVGARCRGIEVDVSARTWSVGMRLRPGALPALTGLPASDFTDRSVVARLLPGWTDSVARFEYEAAAAAASGEPQRVLSSLGRLLDERAAQAGEVSWVARGLDQAAAEAESSRRVSDVAARLGIATRTLRVRSAAEVGLGPKTLLRVGRLFKALRLADARGYRGWATVAQHAGYADQAHLVRDFRMLLGESPTRYARRRMGDADSYKPGRPRS